LEVVEILRVVLVLVLPRGVASPVWLVFFTEVVVEALVEITHEGRYKYGCVLWSEYS
jgi:hypothetical protein